MHFQGVHTIVATPEGIWEYLFTPSRLKQCLPGCERFEQVAPDRYEATMRLGVAFLKGTYHGTVHITEQEHPNWFRLAVEGSGLLGSLTAEGILRFTRLGGRTEVQFDGEAHVGGRVAGFGERVIALTADRLLGLFFDCVARQLAPTA